MNKDKNLTSRVILVQSDNFQVYLCPGSNVTNDVFKLRYHCFKKIVNENNTEPGIEKDCYDLYFDHLVIEDIKSENIIGTYRVQTYEKANKGYGFYNHSAYKLEDIPTEVLQNCVETSRACVAKQYRGRLILAMLWKGVARYIEQHKKRYLFGSISFFERNWSDAVSIMNYFKTHNFYHPNIYIHCKEEAQLALPYHSNTSKKISSISKTDVPDLFISYFKLGAKIISEPVWDPAFSSIDFLILLDIAKLDRLSSYFLK